MIWDFGSKHCYLWIWSQYFLFVYTVIHLQAQPAWILGWLHMPGVQGEALEIKSRTFPCSVSMLGRCTTAALLQLAPIIAYTEAQF